MFSRIKGIPFSVHEYYAYGEMPSISHSFRVLHKKEVTGLFDHRRFSKIRNGEARSVDTRANDQNSETCESPKWLSAAHFRGSTPVESPACPVIDQWNGNSRPLISESGRQEFYYTQDLGLTRSRL